MSDNTFVVPAFAGTQSCKGSYICPGPAFAGATGS